MQLILSIGLKGGVGKTTVAVGMARALAEDGDRVGILDLDYRTPNVPLAMDGGVARLEHSYDEDSLIPPEIDGIKVMSMAYIWPDYKCVQVEDADAMEDVVHLLKPGIIDWGPLDYLVLDMPPTSVGVCRAALEAENLKGAVIVTHASSFSRMDTVRTLDLFAEQEVPVIGLVCNQSWFWQDGIAVNRYDLDETDITEVAERYGLPLLASIPHSQDHEELKSHFKTLVSKLRDITPVTLKIDQPQEGAWKSLLVLTNKLRPGSSSS